ncbi:MAG TPA: tetratricopeptide repeat protein [Bryobacteraceae bacterium]
MRNTFTLMLAASATAALLAGQSQKDQIIQLQRDLAQTDEHVREVQKSQNEKLEALTQLVQQSLDASTKVSATMATLQQGIASTLADQQKKVLDPLTNQLMDIRVKSNQTADDVGSIRETVADLQRRVNELSSKFSDILTQLQLLNHPPAPPPAANPAPGTAAAGPPPGFSCSTAFQDARRDYSGGNSVLAMQEFVAVVKNCGPQNDANAPLAQYYIGMLYDQDGQYDDAAKAFDHVVEQFPKNEKTCESMFRKGDELKKAMAADTDAASKASHKSDAIEALDDYLKTCPGDTDHLAAAKQDLRSLSPPARGANKKK